AGPAAAGRMRGPRGSLCARDGFSQPRRDVAPRFRARRVPILLVSVAGDRAKFTLLAVSAAGRDRKPVERIDAARAAFSRRARRLSRALSRRGSTAAHTAVAALWARRLQLPAPGYLRRACFSVAGGDSVVRNGTRLRRRRIRGDRAAAPRAVARRSADAPPGRYGHICRSRPARHGLARHLPGEASAWRQ